MPSKSVASGVIGQKGLVKLTCVLFVGVGVTLAGCGDQELPDGEDRDETVLVDVDTEPTVSIGAVEGDPMEEFQGITQVSVQGDSVLAVVDGGLKRVRFFDSDGEFLSEEAGEGEGPGELSNVAASWVASDGRVGVVDDLLNRATLYDVQEDSDDLSYPSLPEDATEGGGERPPTVAWWYGQVGDAWLALVEEMGAVPEQGEVLQLEVEARLIQDGQELGETFDLPSLKWYTTDDGEQVRLPVELSPNPDGTVNRDVGAVLDPANHRVLVAEGQDGWSEVALEDHCPSVPDDYFADDGAGAELREGIPLSEFREVVPDCLPPYDELAVTGDGRVWVRRTGSAEDGQEVWKVVDAAGAEVLGVARLPERFVPMDTDSERLYGRWTDDLEVHYVRGYATDD